MLSKFALFSFLMIIFLIAPCYSQTDSAKIDSLYNSGDFDTAKAECQRVLDQNPDDYNALVTLGKIRMMSNHLDKAVQNFSRAVELMPDDTTALKLLAVTYYRQDNFIKASETYRRLDKQVLADKYNSFKDQTPYEISGAADMTSVQFHMTDPLPSFYVSVDSEDSILFILDTGADEITIDPELADKIKAPRFGSTTGTFAGGRHSEVEHGRLNHIELGDFTIKNIPVAILDTRKFAAVTGGQRVYGIIGTAFLRHFLATIDYPNDQLVLRKKTASADNIISAANYSGQFWLADKHTLLARGALNKKKSALFFIDTGLAGAAFTGPGSIFQEAGIEMSGDSFEGVGGGGKVTVTPVMIDEISLGDAARTNVMGLVGAFPESTEYKFGFRIGGIISHGFFRPFALTFDFENMQYYLQ